MLLWHFFIGKTLHFLSAATRRSATAVDLMFVQSRQSLETLPPSTTVMSKRVRFKQHYSRHDAAEQSVNETGLCYVGILFFANNSGKIAQSYSEKRQVCGNQSLFMERTPAVTTATN
jgi:hypothetical protein